MTQAQMLKVTKNVVFHKEGECVIAFDDGFPRAIGNEWVIVTMNKMEGTIVVRKIRRQDRNSNKPPHIEMITPQNMYRWHPENGCPQIKEALDALGMGTAV